MTYTKKLLLIPALCFTAFQVLAGDLQIGYRCEVQEQFPFPGGATTIPPSKPHPETKITPCPAPSYGGQSGLVFLPSTATVLQSPLTFTAGNTFCPRDVYQYSSGNTGYNKYGARVIKLYGSVSHIIGAGGSVTFEPAPGSSITFAPVTMATKAIMGYRAPEALIAQFVVPDAADGSGCNTNYVGQIVFKTKLNP